MEFDYREKLTDYLPVFMEIFEKQLNKDEIRWGDTWKHRSMNGQDDRMYMEMMRYFDQYHHGGQPLPYLKIIGNAFINWVREWEKELSEIQTEISCEE